MSQRHVLLEPWWVVAHLIVLAVLIGFPRLGMWQLDRWEEEREIQARIDDRVGSEPVELTRVLTAETSDPAALEFVPVTVEGTWLAAEEVAQRNRQLDGQGGFDWLTPLVLEDGSAILVRRGFVPPERRGAPTALPAQPVQGRVTVTGWLERPVSQPGFGASDPAEGVLETVFHADLERIGQQVSVPLLPMLLHLGNQQPGQPDQYPIPQSLPERDPGQNLSYAIQWFSFTVIVAVGYAIVLWRTGRNRDAGQQQAGSDTVARDAG